MKMNSAAPRQPRFPLSIGDAAVAIGVSTSTLRYYEREGIVAPIRFGADDRRLYLPEHIKRIQMYRASLGRR